MEPLNIENMIETTGGGIGDYPPFSWINSVGGFTGKIIYIVVIMLIIVIMYYAVVRPIMKDNYQNPYFMHPKITVDGFCCGLGVI